MGAWKVAVHDNTRLYQPWEKPYFVLSAGDVYNMKTRKVEKYGTGARGRGATWWGVTVFRRTEIRILILSERILLTLLL